MKKKHKKEQATSAGKQSVQDKELSYLRKHAESSAIAAFANRKPLKQ